MDLVACPFCHLRLPSSELEWHANNHFVDEEEQQRLATDLELAQQIALAPPSPPSLSCQVISDLPFELGFKESSDGECSIHEKVSCLIDFQTRSMFHRVEGGLMALLRNCLELESENTTSIISDYVDHFQSVESEDVGWGCGWRNIQMLTSHLLHQRQEAREVLFGGSGFIPDIPSLQRWLEIAWEKGFDEPGSDHFDKKIYGLKKWIGTTECAALLRSFGLRAVIVDFGPKEFESLYLSVPGSSIGAEVNGICNGGKKRGVQVYGPMDRYVVRKNHDSSQSDSSVQEKSSSSNMRLGQSLGSENTITRRSRGQQVLVDWVWNYFSDKNSNKSGNGRVIVSEKAAIMSRPLYFQHDGHSRTIIGIQIKGQHNGVQQYNLLIMDPAHRTAALAKSLKENVGWQKLIKRGFHTLKKPQYQLCYVDPGIASGEEMESLKTMNSVFLEL
ncbi:Peptidase C78, ubiquitin fold modifier-specific peptidase [Trema orientale]|uniref:Peptidase C78, ubiquitin fold modifier-specific peptidase n=1 Tax=Trema orientale TaxID=63057 RepID=A0A2P5EDW4_TREOI|nr:Peptidase C78, ubiquitin fold modifier-specific peptidase [Trema orientale]